MDSKVDQVPAESCDVVGSDDNELGSRGTFWVDVTHDLDRSIVKFQKGTRGEGKEALFLVLAVEVLPVDGHEITYENWP